MGGQLFKGYVACKLTVWDRMPSIEQKIEVSVGFVSTFPLFFPFLIRGLMEVKILEKTGFSTRKDLDICHRMIRQNSGWEMRRFI